MLGVLGDPVAVADPDPEVAAPQTNRSVEPPRAEGLAVAGVVAQEGHLREYRSQICGDEQLVPHVADQEQGRPTGRIEDADQSQPHSCTPRRAIEKPGLANLPGELQELVIARRLRTRKGRGHRRGHWRTTPLLFGAMLCVQIRDGLVAQPAHSWG